MSDHDNRGYRFRRERDSRYWFKQRRRQDSKLQRPLRFRPGQPVELAPIVDPENLIAVFHHCTLQGGPAPGTDGIRSTDMGRSELGEAVRAVSRAILQGRYRPQPAKVVRIPKSGGGTRTLKIRPTIDRMVAAAVNEAIRPPIEKDFVPTSMGCQPDKDIYKLLAQLAATVITNKRFYITCNDVRQAFDNVRPEYAVTAFGRHIDDDGVMRLIQTIMAGEAPGRTIGIDQGCPLSPLALNTLLDQALDKPLLAAFPGIPFWRYLDDIVTVNQNESQGRDAMQQISQLLKSIGMELKWPHRTVNLQRQGAYVDLLGFRISCQSVGRLNFAVTDEKWRDLKRRLMECHEEPYPTEMAQQAMEGWIAANGPAFSNAEERDVLARASDAASRAGLGELDLEDSVRRVLRTAYGRWETTRQDALDGLRTAQGNVLPSCIPLLP